MQRVTRHLPFALFVAGLVAVVFWLFFMGGSLRIALWAAGEQREVQNAMAGALRAVRAGEPAAMLALLGLCFAYGFFHAAGPGHGKLLMGGYALSADVPRVRLIGLTLAGALGQALTAILLVTAGALLLGWGRQQMTGLADGPLALFSAGAVALVGLWLAWRGARRLWRMRAGPELAFAGLAQSAHHPDHHDHHHEHDHHHHHHSHGHDHDHSGHDHGVCPDCGHAHAPDPEDIARVSNWREGAALVLAVAVRPCTGALFVLILTYGMGIWLAGVLGALAMGLGTAVLTLAVTLSASLARSGMAQRLSGASGVRAMAGVEILAGLTVALVATQVAMRLA